MLPGRDLLIISVTFLGLPATALTGLSLSVKRTELMMTDWTLPLVLVLSFHCVYAVVVAEITLFYIYSFCRSRTSCHLFQYLP